MKSEWITTRDFHQRIDPKTLRRGEWITLRGFFWLVAATKLLKCVITVRDGGGETNRCLVMLLLSGISLSVLIVGFALGYGTRASVSQGPPTDNVRRRAF